MTITLSPSSIDPGNNPSHDHADIDAPTTPVAHPADVDPDRSPTTWAPSAFLAISTVLTGLFAGFFFTYSASVVLGLGQVDDLTYVRTFQAINDTIRNPAFAVVFFGSVPVTAIAIALHRTRRIVRHLATAGLLLTLTVMAITFAGSVPLNNELATYTELDAVSAATARGDFESTWNLLNLARTVLATGAAVALAAASIAVRGTRRSEIS